MKQILFLFLSFVTITASAQSIVSVSGLVTDKSAAPIP